MSVSPARRNLAATLMPADPPPTKIPLYFMIPPRIVVWGGRPGLSVRPPTPGRWSCQALCVVSTQAL